MGIFWGDNFFGSTRSSSEHSEQLGFFEGGDFWVIAFLGALGAARSTRIFGEKGEMWGVRGRSEVVRRRCSALLVLRREGGGGF